jgi:hypothetical protein
VSGVHAFQLASLQLILGPLSPYLNKVLNMDPFSSQISATYKKTRWSLQVEVLPVKMKIPYSESFLKDRIQARIITTFCPLICLASKDSTDSDMSNKEVTIPCLFFSYKKDCVKNA